MESLLAYESSSNSSDAIEEVKSTKPEEEKLEKPEKPVSEAESEPLKSELPKSDQEPVEPEEKSKDPQQFTCMQTDVAEESSANDDVEEIGLDESTASSALDEPSESSISVEQTISSPPAIHGEDSVNLKFENPSVEPNEASSAEDGVFCPPSADTEITRRKRTKTVKLRESEDFTDPLLVAMDYEESTEVSKPKRGRPRLAGSQPKTKPEKAPKTPKKLFKKVLTVKLEPLAPDHPKFFPIDEETRNSFTNAKENNVNSSPVTPSASNTRPAASIDETSQESSGSVSTKKKIRYEVYDPELDQAVTADLIFEYQWPAHERNADYFMLQEQVANYLGIKSFKRKYPKMTRRPLEREEKALLRDRGVVSGTTFDLGVTVLRSEEVLDAMAQDFPDKFEELRIAMQEKRQKRAQEQRLASATPAKANQGGGAEKTNPAKLITDPRMRLIHETAEFNARFNRERLEERPCAFDMQSSNVVYPMNKILRLSPELSKVGNYPVALMPSQYTDYYQTYKPDALKYLPLNTVMYGPVNPYADAEIEDDNKVSSSDSSSGSDSEDSNASS
ncbi:unnamed protein product [Notodromas monacha]|uniref:SWI/SNF Subunit INI1 DNA binding domain-containing protein n=1 Tax=Notodromas monacha TaxID=399045 RepID=A0A7R9BD20_9CRUS|nr:unnamed protein product [Notodromas monacha]CAG0913110.1 unnamed protein product [Notodromas monacha]